MSNIGTVNVITFSNERDHTSIRDFKSWLDNPDGNKAAEQYFAEQIRIKAPFVTVEEVENMIENGYAHSAGREYIITHST